MLCSLHTFVHIKLFGAAAEQVGEEVGGRAGGYRREGGAAALMRHSSSVPKWDEHAGDKEVVAGQAGRVSARRCGV